MFKKIFYLSCILLVLSITSASMADLLAYYSMDEGSGSGVADGSGNGHDGLISSTPTWTQGAPGDGTAVQFGSGIGSGVLDCGNWDTTNGTGAFTVAFWVKFTPNSASYTQYQGVICNRNSNTDQYWGLELSYTNGATTGSYYFGAAGAGGATAYGLGNLTVGTWTHLALSFDGTTCRTYVNGVAGTTSTTPRYSTTPNKTAMVRIGASEETSNVFQGVIDEVYFYSGILTVDQIAAVMNGEEKPAGNPGLPTKPNPGNKATEVSIDVGEISWTPGEYANTQNVFFGTNPDDVNTATVANPLSTTVYAIASDVNVIDLARLEYGTTYYWRVDEVNAPDKPATIVGPTWKFTTQLKGYILAGSHISATANDPAFFEDDAQDPNSTCNGAGLDANDMHGTARNTMWLAQLPDDGLPGDAYIQYKFDMPYKFNDMRIWNYNEEDPLNGYGAKDINILYSLDGENWLQLGDTVTLEMAPGDNTCTANAPIDMQGVAAQYVKVVFLSSLSEGDQLYGISEVRFTTMPTYAALLTPANAATNQALNVAMTWAAGRDAVEHRVYYSTDANNMGSAHIASDTSFVPTDLDLNKKYYWRVDEVNNAEPYPIWPSTVRSFSTVLSLLVDGFETYGSTEEDYIWAVWKDGVETSANGGSEIGKDIVPAAGRVPGLSTTVIHTGTYSLPVNYDNTGASGLSQVSAQSVALPIGTANWQIGSPTALVVWIRGEPNNTPAQLYVKLNSSKVLYTGDTGYLSQSFWRPYVFDLSKFNISLSNVTSITIGLEKSGAMTGKGRILIDDISLYGVAPTIAEAVNPGTNGLVASYSMENNVLDGSGNGHNGTIVGTPTYTQGMSGHGMAMLFNGTSDAVDIGNSTAFNFTGSFTISVWAKLNAWSTGWGYTMVGNRGESDKGGWQIRRYSGTGGRFCFTTRGVSNDDFYSNAYPIPQNEWVNFTCVYDSVAFTKTIYINGMLDRTINLTGTTKTVTATTGIDTYIGARANTGNTGPENFFNGLLDDIRIYNRALSAGEAAYLAKPTP